MSTEISQAQLATTLPKSIAKLKPMDDKPDFNRSSSIDTIKKINTYICSPQLYVLPVMLTTWLKTGQNSLQSSTEKTIFMFRSLIFGSFVFKFLLNGTKPGHLGGQASKLDLPTVLAQIFVNLQEQLSVAADSLFVISLAFKLAVVLMTVQMCLCAFYLSQSVVPVGLSFLLLSIGYIVGLGYKLNRSYLMKRDVKSKRL